MRSLIIGASGLVGGALLRAADGEAVGTYRTRAAPGLRPLDARDQAAVADIVRETRPDVILFPAAEPDVEWCEREPAEARARNLDPLHATLRASIGIPVLAFSSDYVFDGRAGPYTETDPPAPISEYGRIKLELERLVLEAGGTVVRTTTVFGLEHGDGKNFVQRLARTLARGERVRVPDDQVSTPTYADDLAAATVRLAAVGARGVWHLAGPDLVSRSELAHRVARAFGVDEELIDAVRTAELGQGAARPLNGGLLCLRFCAAFGNAGRPLDDALGDMAARTQG